MFQHCLNGVSLGGFHRDARASRAVPELPTPAGTAAPYRVLVRMSLHLACGVSDCDAQLAFARAQIPSLS